MIILQELRFLFLVQIVNPFQILARRVTIQTGEQIADTIQSPVGEIILKSREGGQGRSRRYERDEPQTPHMLDSTIARIAPEQLIAASARERNGDRLPGVAGKQVSQKESRIAEGLVEVLDHIEQFFGM